MPKIPKPFLLPHSTPLLSGKPILAFSATLISAIIPSEALLSANDDDFKKKSSDLYVDLEHAIERSNDSLNKIVNQMKQTGIAAAVLLKSLRSVLSSANHEVRSGFELRVASLLADIAAAKLEQGL